MRRRNPSEVDHWISELKSGLVTAPAAARKRIAELQVELEDVIALDYPPERVAQIQATIDGLEKALLELPQWQSAARERLLRSISGESAHWASRMRSGQVPPTTLENRIADLRSELEDVEDPDLAEAIKTAIADLEITLARESTTWETAARKRLEEHGKEIAAAPRRFLEPTERERLLDEFDRLGAKIKILRRDLEEAMRLRDPLHEIEGIRRQIRFAQDDLADVRTKLERGAPTVRNAGHRRRPPSSREAADMTRDIAAGRIDMDDVMRRIDVYREALADVLRNDPLARKRIESLIEHIRGLENVVLRLRDDSPGKGVA